jgi:CubicO group peptidase (beta-lactamase class C family)
MTNHRPIASLATGLPLLLCALSVNAGPVHAQAAACGVPTANIADETAASLQAFLDGIIEPRMTEDRVAGATVSVVGGGRLLFAKGYGLANVAEKRPVDASTTLFRIASISKLFTATAVMQQVERRRLTLDDDVRRWVDVEFHRISPAPITLRTLLTHTAGFEEGAFGMSENRAEDALPLGENLRRTMPWQIRAPGAGISYSNHGVSVAGYAVERSSGLPFAEFIARNIFVPLDMSHSSFVDPLPAALARDLAQAYEYRDGRFHEAPYQFSSELGPSASLSTTSTDMAHFMIAELEQGRYGDTALLSPASLAEMQREQYSISPTHASSVGLIYSRTFRNGTLILSHGGDLRDFVSALVLLPGAHAGLFASFSSMSAGRVVNELPAAFIDRYLGTACRATPTGRVDTGRLTGTYRLSRSVESNFAKLAYLFIEFPVSEEPGVALHFDGGRFVPLDAGRFAQVAAGPSGREWGTLEFFERAGTMQIAFSEDPFVSAHRLPVLESSATMKLTLVAAVLFLLLLVGRTLWVRIRHRAVPPRVRRQRWFAVASILLIVAFWVGLVVFLLTSGILDTGFGAVVPLTLRALLCLPWLAAVAAAAAAADAFVLARERIGEVIDRAFALLFVPLMVGLLALMSYWRLLGRP